MSSTAQHPSRSSAVLPSELWDAILDIVWSTDIAAVPALASPARVRAAVPLPSPSIHAGALVCKAWLPRTRHHVFGHLCVGHKRRSPARFVELVSHPLCTFRLVVHRLTLKGKDHKYKDLNALWGHLSLLPNIDALDLDTVNLNAKTGPVFSPQMIPPTLKSLRIIWPRFQSIWHMMACIAQCRQLESLTISQPEDTRSWGDYLPPGRIGAPPQTIKELCVHWGAGTVTMQELLVWLCPSPGAMKPTWLTLRCVGTGDAPDIARFVRDVGPSVEELSVNIPNVNHELGDAGIQFLCEQGGFSTLTSLRTLTIFGDITRKPHYDWAPYDSRPTAFCSPSPHYLAALLPSCPVREIRFRIAMYRLEHWSLVSWPRVLQGLAGVPLFERVVWEITLETAWDEHGAHVWDGVKEQAQEFVAAAARRPVDVLFKLS